MFFFKIISEKRPGFFRGPFSNYYSHVISTVILKSPTRSLTAMASRISTAVVLTCCHIFSSFVTHAGELPKLQVLWHGTIHPKCQKRVELFMEELQYYAPEYILELEKSDHKTVEQRLQNKDWTGPHDFLAIECLDMEKIQAQTPQHAQILKFNEKHQGFSPLDWYHFQKTILRQFDHGFFNKGSNIDAWQQPIEESSPSQLPETALESTSSSIFKKWWFWTVVAGTLGGISYWTWHKIQAEQSRTLLIAH